MVSAQAQSVPGAAAAKAATLPEDLKIPDKAPKSGVYNVVLADQAETMYDGHVTGYAATRPASGDSFEDDADAARYRGYLEAKQDTVLSKIRAGEPLYRYTTALNGFSAELSGTQVEQLRGMPGVLSVEADRLRKIDTVDSPKFLGLSGPKGVWARNGGTEKAGKNVVVGVVDSGIWPSNPSFAGAKDVPEVPGFDGICEAGERWKTTTCNSKIISARYFIKGFGEDNIAKAEFASPRDGSGHGSHTASTAAGNNGVDVKIEGTNFGKASGMAPAAKIAVYKVCYSAIDPANDGCFNSDSVAAINKAVRDGVDVINFSISGTQDNFADSVELAFLGAAAGGVFVAASAGNSGPAPSSVAHPSPWIATVAASTHHVFQGSVELGNGKSYVGSMISDEGVGKRRIVLSSDVGKPGADPAEVALCYLGTLDPAKVENRIVVCDRGTIDRVEKSAAVKRAGGVGMVLVNTTPNTIDADFHAVPTVHLDVADGTKVKAYVESAGAKARASLNPNARGKVAIPQIAGFSSRGPLIAGNGDILKPDLSAPGVSVIAAVAPPSNFGRNWDVYSGTSMSSPHVAGLGAFIRHERPHWSPAMIKSAMMTTAYDLKKAHSPFVQGAGHVNPKKFLDPGLVYDARLAAWLNFLTGEKPARQLNQASIALGRLTGNASVIRTVTNVSDSRETYKATVQGMPGVDVKVSPSNFSLSPGRSTKYRVSFEAQPNARFNKYSTGNLVLRGSEGHRVRSPLVVRPVAVDAPAEVVEPFSATGETVIRGKAGFTGELDLAVVGLEGATPEDGTVDQGDFVLIDSVNVPAGTAVARFDLNAEDDADDLDLYLGVGANLVAASATGAADEQITLERPAAATYDVYVDGFTDADGGGSPYTYTGWVVPKGPQGNLTVDPDPVPVTSGEPFRYTAEWTGLLPAQRYFGYVNYVGAGERTYITVN